MSFFKKGLSKDNDNAEDWYYAVQVFPSIGDWEKPAYGRRYPSLKDFQEDYEIASSPVQDYVPVYTCPALGCRSYFYKTSEVEEAIKNLVELPADLEGIYNKFGNPDYPTLAYRGTLYVPPAELERCKNWASVEREPLVFPDTEGVWFFKLGDTYFKSTTPSYWLFLYNQFGYLNQEKLTEKKIVKRQKEIKLC